MPEVTVRDAQRGDAPAISRIWSATVPYQVRSAACASADMREDRTLRRRRWVGLVDTVVAGTAAARLVSEHEVLVSVEVHPDQGSRGVGTALLLTAVTAFPDAARLRAVSNKDPISMAFAIRNGFLPEGEDVVGVVDPRSTRADLSVPAGMRAVTLDALPDLRMLLETVNLAVGDDPRGQARHLTMYQLRAEWWGRPDNAPGHSFGLVDDAAARPVLTTFTSVQLDRDRGCAESTLTATHPDYRGRGLATWVKRRMLTSLAEAGVRQAWCGLDSANPPMRAVNQALGYRPGAASVRLTRRIPT